MNAHIVRRAGRVSTMRCLEACGTVFAMFWIVAGAALVVSGLAIVAAAARGARRAGSTGANGLAIAVGGGLALWGVIALVVGFLTQG